MSLPWNMPDSTVAKMTESMQQAALSLVRTLTSTTQDSIETTCCRFLLIAYESGYRRGRVDEENRTKPGDALQVSGDGKYEGEPPF